MFYNLRMHLLNAKRIFHRRRFNTRLTTSINNYISALYRNIPMQDHLKNFALFCILHRITTLSKRRPTSTSAAPTHIAMDFQGYLALCYALSITLIVAMALYALWRGYSFRRRITNTESFITARGQVGTMRIAWSFYAGAVGAWVIASPASYASTAGLLGLVFYALSSGLPFIMIAFAGEMIRNKIPHVLSLTDFIRWRFGLAAKTYVVLLILFNMSIALLAEYTTIGSIFQSYVGSVPYPIILTVGFLTMAYTAYGGLLVSIYTDRIQGIASVVFFGVLAIYMAVTFRPASLPTPMPCSPTDPFCISGTPSCSAFDAYSADNPDAPVPCPIVGLILSF